VPSGFGSQTRGRKRARVTMSEEALPLATVRRMKELVGEGASKKALDILLLPGSHDPSDPMVLSGLRELHPAAPPVDNTGLPATVDPALGDSSDNPGFWEHLVRDAIVRFPRASAAGPSGLRPSHLQDGIKRRGGGLALIAALGVLCRHWIGGSLPKGHAQWLSGATSPRCGKWMEGCDRCCR
jgi:hypothetical protein